MTWRVRGGSSRRTSRFRRRSITCRRRMPWSSFPRGRRAQEKAGGGSVEAGAGDAGVPRRPGGDAGRAGAPATSRASKAPSVESRAEENDAARSPTAPGEPARRSASAPSRAALSQASLALLPASPFRRSTSPQYRLRNPFLPSPPTSPGRRASICRYSPSGRAREGVPVSMMQCCARAAARQAHSVAAASLPPRAVARSTCDSSKMAKDQGADARHAPGGARHRVRPGAGLREREATPEAGSSRPRRHVPHERRDSSSYETITIGSDEGKDGDAGEREEEEEEEEEKCVEDEVGGAACEPCGGAEAVGKRRGAVVVLALLPEAVRTVASPCRAAQRSLGLSAVLEMTWMSRGSSMGSQRSSSSAQ